MGALSKNFPWVMGYAKGIHFPLFLFLLAVEGFHMMMDSLINNNLFSGYKVGRERSLSVSHLQFADDTLILGEKSWANGRAMRVVLHLFAAMSRLKINFHKSELVGVNIGRSWLLEATIVLNCKMNTLPILYLGLLVGGHQRQLNFWDHVVNRIESRLSSWKSRHLSFCGRLALLMSILTSLPVYAVSFFKAPSGVIASINSLLLRFFWVGGAVRKMGKYPGLIGSPFVWKRRLVVWG